MAARDMTIHFEKKGVKDAKRVQGQTGSASHQVAKKS